MKCPSCGTMMKVTKKNYNYEEAGLKNVLLCNLNVYECPSCAEELPELPNITALHNGIASHLIRKQSPLTGEEVRFLRKSMEMKASELAGYLGVSPVTVSRWETNAESIGPQSDRLVRALYLFYKERTHHAGFITVVSKSFEAFGDIAKQIVQKEPKSETISIPPTELEELSY